ncbi:MAG: hypothetical protein ACK571_05025, partial [Pseudanabaena sp.]
FCDAMIAIKQEVNAIASGAMDKLDNPLKNAPHTAEPLLADDWSHAYSRHQAADPEPWLKEHKFWASVGRIDNAFGDRNFVCSCQCFSKLWQKSSTSQKIWVISKCDTILSILLRLLVLQT